MDKVKRGFFFTIDAVFALLILLSVVYLFTLVSLESVSPELMQDSLYSQAGDTIGTLARLKLADVWSQDEVRDLYGAGIINDKDLNNTILEATGALWALDTPQDSEAARNLTDVVLRNMVSQNVQWAFIIDNETLYNTTSKNVQSRIVTVSRRMVSGYMKSQPHVGFTARAFISNILGKQSSEYFFFGGFVGQGNLTAVLREIPSDANLSYIYLEMNTGGNFTLYINDKYCGLFNRSGSNYSTNSWTIAYPQCLGNISKGGLNNFTFNFTGQNFSQQYVGGGYIRVVYDTTDFGLITTGVKRYYFPGIDGIANLYDSFYVPGNLTNITGYLKVYNNYTTLLTVGNKTILEQNGTGGIDEIYLQDFNFSSLLNYPDLSEMTVPLRLSAGANTGATIGIGDIVLITDRSGSMNWRVGYDDDDSGSQWSNNCLDPRMYTSQETQRLALARCLDKQFIEIVLNKSGNRVALVSFDDNIQNSTNLTSNAAYLNSTVNTYTASGGTCICCAVNKAREILESESGDGRRKYIVVMTDGIAGYRCSNIGSCYWWAGTPNSGTDSILYDVDFINGTRGYAVGTRLGGGRIMRWDGTAWGGAQSVGSTLYGIHIYNSTLGFAVGGNGLIMKWNGAAWAADTSPVGSDLRSVFIVNGTIAYAVGDSGRVLSWDGSAWVLNTTLAGTLYSVRANSIGTEGFIVGSGGRIYQWTYPTWTAAASPTTRDLRRVAFVNNTYSAYAFGMEGTILRWDGATWAADPTVLDWNNRTAWSAWTTVDFYAAYFTNDTLGYAFGENGSIFKWNTTLWIRDYSPTSQLLYGAAPANESLAFAVGAVYLGRARIINWTQPIWSGLRTTGSQCCSGTSPQDCLNSSCEAAVMNTIWSAGYANATIQNLTVHSIGFGPVASCTNGQIALQGAAEAGNGTYYASDNASELKLIYEQIGLAIYINATAKQEVTVVGGIRTTLYPESYLEFHFNATVPPLGYKEITITQETSPLGSCDGSFYIPEWLIPYEARVTSYSADYWTHNVTVMSPNTGNAWMNVFNLSRYLTPYALLGDPFNVQFPASFLKPNETNYVNVTTGISPTNESTQCPTDNKVIYKAKLPASVPFSSVLPEAIGHNVTVYYDLNGDGVADGSKIVLLGYDTEGVTFDSTPRTVDELTPEFNALDDAFIRLLDYINFDPDRDPNPLCAGDESSGEACNPIDVELSPDILIRVSSVTEIPYMWGPVEMGMVAWIGNGD